MYTGRSKAVDNFQSLGELDFTWRIRITSALCTMCTAIYEGLHGGMLPQINFSEGVSDVFWEMKSHGCHGVHNIYTFTQKFCNSYSQQYVATDFH